MQKNQILNIVGISVRTTNENNQVMIDIPKLWDRFFSENILAQIPNKVNNDFYCIYTNYELDFTKPYTTIIGCEVSNLDEIPDGMISKTFQLGNLKKYTAKGNLMQGAVYNEWQKIWSENLNRKYTADFEVYGEKAQNFENAEVDIFIEIE